MSKRKINSRNTENPYELISGIRLRLKENKNIEIGISATKSSNVSDEKGNKYSVMLDFDVYSKYKAKYDEDYAAIKLFKNIEKFANICKNPLEVITLFIDAYKENKNDLTIRIFTHAVYPDALDSKFVYESLLK